MIFSNSQYSRLKSRLKQKYHKHLGELKTTSPSHIAHWLSSHQSEINIFSNLNWLFVTQIQNYFFFKQFDLNLGKYDFGETEELVFERWNQSEFADVFLKNLNRGQRLGKANQETLKLYDQHLVAFGNRHILKIQKISKHYRPQTSLGDTIRGKNLSRLLETTLHIDGKELRLMTSTLKEMKDFSQKIEVALKVIKKHSPTSWDRFKAFTEVIIPIKQQELVSYSHQDLPGYSMINLYHRDFVDLMDDLLHENGHHHLNYYLNLGKLIDEPIDNIYYSPWRRTLRPLRGVYHAYFTFFWAFKLFADLARAKDVDSIWYVFGNKEKEKIYWRAVEEFHMLNYTYNELKWAKNQGLIHQTGWKLIEEQHQELTKFKRYIPLWEKKLGGYKKDLKDLKKTIEQAKRDFSKN